MEQTKSKFSAIFEDVSAIANTKADIILLDVTEKVSKVSGTVASGLLLAVVFIITLVFGSVALAWFLGEKLGSVALGFCILTFFYLILFVLVYAFGKKIIQNSVASLIIKNVIHDNE